MISKRSSSRSRVLIALHRFSIGGAETQALQLALGLKTRGFEVLVVAFSPGSISGRGRFETAKIPCFELKFSEKIILAKSKTVFSIFRKLKYISKFILTIRQFYPDVIIPFTYYPNVIYGDFNRFLGARKCLWNQRDEGRLFGQNKRDIQILNKSHSIVSNSVEGKVFLKKYTSKPIALIPNGVNLKKYSSVEPNWESTNIVMIGNIHGYKDHQTLIKSWAFVAKQFPNRRLLLAGNMGSKSKDVVELIIRLELTKKIILLGVVDDLKSLMSNCSLAVFSSENEGVPNGILEPMACGLPVVATDIEGSREALGSEYPYLVKSGDTKSFSNKIISLLGNPIESKRIGELNRRRVDKFFSIDKMVDKFELQINC